MYRAKPKILRINKAIIFIGFVCVFLLSGLDVLAANCDKSGWNRVNCDVTIDYADPCLGGICSGLSSCLYAMGIGAGADCPSQSPSDPLWNTITCSGSTYSTTTTNVIGPTGICTAQGSDSCKICSMAEDSAGNMSTVVSQTYDLDYTAPNTSISPNGVECINSSSNFTLTCTDVGGSGCKQVEYKTVDEGQSCDATTTLTVVSGTTASGNFTCSVGSVCRKKVCYRSADNAGNVGTLKTSNVFEIDQVNPVQVAWDPTNRDWDSTNVSVSVQYSDSDCGMKETKYCWVAAGGSCTPNVLFSTAGGGTITKSDSGGWKLCVTATDNANNSVTECKEPYRIDKEAPTTTISPNGLGWVKSDINFTLTCADNPSGTAGVNNSGCETNGTEYKVIGSTSTCDAFDLNIGNAGTVSCPSGEACQKKVCFRSRDKAGNFESIKTSNLFRIDKKDPYRTSWNPLSRDCNGANTDISVAVQFIDDDSGLASSKYCWTTGGSCSPGTSFSSPSGGTAVQSSTGVWTLCVSATDNVNNSSPAECLGTYTVDKNPPSNPNMNPSSRNWLNEDVLVSIIYADSDSNLCDISFTKHCWTTSASCDPGTTTVSTFSNGGQVSQSNNGAWTLCARARDGAGNWSAASCSVQGAYKIDKDPPSLVSRTPESRDWDTADISVVVRYTDALSGVNSTSYCWTKDSTPCSPTYFFNNNTAITQSENGEWMLCTNARDVATNLSTTDCSAPGAYKKHAVPVCSSLVALPSSGSAPFAVIFTGCGQDPDGGAISQYEFDFFGNGSVKAFCPGDPGCVTSTDCYIIGYVYNSAGNFYAKLRVKDDHNIWSADGSGACTRLIAATGNFAPTLSWTGEANYASDGLNPEIGNSSTNFVYRIKYTDPDNDAPNFVRLHIKKGGTEISGSPFLMDFSNGTYSGGAIYTYTKTGLAQGSDYTYYFEAQDIKGSNANPTPERTAPLVDNTNPQVTNFDFQPRTLTAANPNGLITWTVTDSGGSHLDHVEIWRVSDSSGAPGTNWQQVGANYNAPADSDGPWTNSASDSPPDGVYWYGLHVLDKAGNLGTEPSPIKVIVDKTPPPSPTCAPGTGNYPNLVVVNCTDSESGVVIRYTTDGTAPVVSSSQYVGPLTFTSDAVLTVAAWDGVANRSSPDNSYVYAIQFSPINMPTVSTDEAENIMSSSARLKGTLTNLGGASSCDVWFEWGTTTSLGNITPHMGMTALGPFYYNISGLETNKTYYFVAKAQNSYSW